jgi:hypothetical protein
MTHMNNNGTLTWPEECDVNFSDTGILGSDSSQSFEKSLIYFCACTVRDVQLIKPLSKESFQIPINKIYKKQHLR